MVRILLADDQGIFGDRLQLSLRDYRVTAVIDRAYDSGSTFEKIKKDNYHLIFLNVNMSQSDSIGLMNDIITTKPDTPVLIFSMYNEQVHAKQYMQMGAMGFISKEASGSEIVTAIHNLMENKKYVSPTLLECLVHEVYNDKFSNPFRLLSPRELEILRFLIQGKSLIDISLELDLNQSTVSTYKTRILKKLSCRSVDDVDSLAKIYQFSIR